MVSYGEGENLAKEFKIKFYETSAVEDICVEECFLNIANDVVRRVSGGGGGNSAGPSSGPAKGGSSGTAQLDNDNVNVTAQGKKTTTSWC
jgi:hypothetical protein